ncbi:MAG: ExeA family protein [Candidatus Omnitrophota bacterium]
MYESYWGLKEKPFENTADPRFFYYSAEHEESLFRLLYAVKEQKAAGMLSGVFGCGKTLIARTVLRELGKDVYRTGMITNPQMDYIELLLAIANSLGAKDLPKKKTEVLTNVVLETISEILENNRRDNKKTVLIIDEAHVIEDRHVFEGIRLLLNFQSDNNFLLTLLLLGQPELKEKIDSNKQLSQRIAIRCHLGPLVKEETGKYIYHRLNVAGASRAIFNEEAIGAVFDKSGGIPRRINQICDLGLLTGFGRKLGIIGPEVIDEVSRDLEG